MNNQHIFNNIRVVLCQTSHPGNIGSAARAMKTMGLQHLYLVKPNIFPDAHATALSTGAADLLENAIVCETLSEALTDCALAIGMSARKRQISHELVNVRDAASRAVSIAVKQPIALVFGTEMSGLSNAELDCCQLLAMIPANPEYTSLNLAAAVQVMSYEIRMAVLEGKLEAHPNQPELATNEALEGFYTHLEDTLIKIGYLNPDAPKKLSERIRRIYARAKLEKEEVNLLRGILTLSLAPKKHTKY
ncbi:MAG: RNA methyltransferase [Methylotenera sp.]|nr:RNA methyltransferase [Methylotenera sp.]MDO9234085.1 RNA methyltransferase [Methylotenera sp.]MDO9388336.1 RNA methyltransferase [Methylotenera sp.]MDP1595981.1 RNA methyltransferase [Methylotenera sp.]MDP1754292.1 RNA methyltransferase [Methylotenera sp.]